ncbi:MAG: GNAT family N-acetyltransferase [Anaerolineaceae bacterium]|nr:GNAT family N-acetyltransferase [Anaerolineaceae bacterium]
MPQIEIRPAAITDLNNLAALDASYQSDYVWQMERALDEGQTGITFREVRLPRAVRVEAPRTPIFNKISDANTTVLSAHLTGNLVGYIHIEERQLPDVSCVGALVVRPDIRRKGIGTSLLLAGQEWAANQGMRRMICDVQSKNYAAIRLLAKMGYEFCGYNDYYYANKDIALFFTRFLR